MPAIKLNKYSNISQIARFEVLVAEFRTDGFVIQDTTFDANDEVSNLQPHQYAFPPGICLRKGDIVIVDLETSGEHVHDTEGGILYLYAGFRQGVVTEDDTLVLLQKVAAFPLS